MGRGCKRESAQGNREIYEIEDRTEEHTKTYFVKSDDEKDI